MCHGQKVFGRLELGTLGGLEREANAVGHGEVLGPVPGGIVEVQHDARLSARRPPIWQNQRG
jgi:hypothetical protein